MGHIIRPDGVSVTCDKVDGHIPYEYLVRDIQSDLYTPEYRAKCLRIIQEVGVFKAYKEIVNKTLKQLSSDADSEELRDLAKSMLKKPRGKVRSMLNQPFTD